MIEMHEIVIKYKKEHGLRYVNKTVNNATSLQMARVSLIDKLIYKITVGTLFCLMFTLEKLLNFNILTCIMFQYSCSLNKILEIHHVQL